MHLGVPGTHFMSFADVPGVFMAMHENRQSCGKCGLTYMFDEESKPKAAAKGGKK